MAPRKPNTPEQDELTAACESGDIVRVRNLFPKIGNPNYHQGQALRRAAQFDHEEIVRFLVENGASPTIKRNAAIRHAATNGNVSMLHFLASNRKTDEPDPLQGLLSLASGNGQKDVVIHLIANGVNPEASKGWAMSLAARNGHRETLVELLRFAKDRAFRPGKGLKGEKIGIAESTWMLALMDLNGQHLAPRAGNAI